MHALSNDCTDETNEMMYITKVPCKHSLLHFGGAPVGEPAGVGAAVGGRNQCDTTSVQRMPLLKLAERIRRAQCNDVAKGVLFGALFARSL